MGLGETVKPKKTSKPCNPKSLEKSLTLLSYISYLTLHNDHNISFVRELAVESKFHNELHSHLNFLFCNPSTPNLVHKEVKGRRPNTMKAFEINKHLHSGFILLNEKFDLEPSPILKVPL
jgi:hypothetical protein